MSELELAEKALVAAAADLEHAECRIRTGDHARPASGFESLSGIAEEVDLHLRGLSVARASLADAAGRGAGALCTLLEESSSLDRALAGSLQPGFSVLGGVR
jgi:hypothetical protein